jgi:hypothetical protein
MAKMAAKWVLVGVLLVMSYFAVSVLATRVDEELSARSQFEDWLQKYSRAYGSNPGEKSRRFEIFKTNLDFINEHNAKKSSYKLGLNQFSDLTNAEFKSEHVGKYIPGNVIPTSNTPFRYGDVTPPASIDWRDKGAVTPVKDQGQCGIV